jgi:hypothetical protein
MIGVYRNKKFHEITPMTIYKIVDYFKKDKNKEADLLRESENIKQITKVAIKEIFKQSSVKLQWNIEHMIRFNGNTSYVSIYNKFDIIGYDDDIVYNLVLQTDYNSLSHWDTMISILIQRFLIFNPSAKGNDIEKFSKKKVITYLFILKQNKYEVIDWEWDCNKDIQDIIKGELKAALIQHFSNNTKQLFNYYNFIKTQKDKWESFGTPLKFMSEEFNDVNYVMLFFEELHSRFHRNDKEAVMVIMNDYELFSKELNVKLEQMCDDYFGLHTQGDDDECEW